MSPDLVALAVAVLLMSGYLVVHWRQVLAFLSVAGVALMLLGMVSLVDALHLSH